MSITTNIYALIDPVSGQPRYIGKADNISKRLDRHVNEAKRSKQITHKLTWIRSLIKGGFAPELLILDVVNADEWAFWEKHYISVYKAWGFDLTNGTEGGDGLVKPNEITRRKMSDWQKGNKLSEEHRKNISAALLSSEKFKRSMQSDAHRERSKLGKGKKRTDQTKMRLKEAWKTRKPMSQETIERIAAGNRERNKLRVYPKGYTLTEEHKNKISATWKRKK